MYEMCRIWWINNALLYEKKMGKNVKKTINDNENRIIFLMNDESTSSDESDEELEFVECTYDTFQDRCDKSPSRDYIPLEYKKKVIALADAHPKWSLTSLQTKGASRLKRKHDLKRWRIDVQRGGTIIDKFQTVDSETFEQFKEAKRRNGQISAKHLQQ